MAMNVTRVPQETQGEHGDQGQRPGQSPAEQPHAAQPITVQPDSDVLEQVRARIRAAQGAAAQARQVGVRAEEALADAELLRRRLPVVAAAAERGLRSVRILRGVTPVSLWYAGRRGLAAERGRRSQELRTALAERDELVAQIADQDARARDLRAESLRLRASASALPRLLDEAAACVRRSGGPAAETLAAAEAGLEPVLRREADLDQAVRWLRWAQLHLWAALDRAGGRSRTEGAREALVAAAEVLGVLVQALTDLGVSIEPLAVPDLEPWPAGGATDRATDGERPERVGAGLAGCARAAGELGVLLARVEGDHAATRRVLDSRRAYWCALLRGE
jgi:hypothetical protein